MSWNVCDKVEAEEKLQRMQAAETPPAPEPITLTWEMRKAVIGEFAEFIEGAVPAPHDYIVKLALLDYSCRRLALEPDEDEVTFEPTWE